VAQAHGRHHHRTADATFTKWVVSLPADPTTLAGILMAGVVGGGVGDGVYVGQVISDDTVSQPGFWPGTLATNSTATSTSSSQTST
jgi:hypothetical protein